MDEVEAGNLVTSLPIEATTPGSIVGDEKCLVPSTFRKIPRKLPWYKRHPPPFAILTISLVEIIVFAIANNKLQKLLRFNPNNLFEIWRCVTYMFVHNDAYHIALNVVIQCLIAVPLEKFHGCIRVGILYFVSGIIGALGASCFQPNFVVGASAGVYALLISHLSHIIVNYNSTKHKLWRTLTVIGVVLSDVSYNILHSQTLGYPIISEAAHFAGAVSGFLLGIFLYKYSDKEPRLRNEIAFLAALALSVILICFILIVKYQIMKCTPVSYRELRYSYSC